MDQNEYIITSQAKRAWQTKKRSKSLRQLLERLKLKSPKLGWWFLDGGFWMVEDLEDLQFHGA